MSPQYTTIYLVRHGESVWNIKQLVQGHLQDTENTLTLKGEEQAKELASHLKNIQFNAVYSSDLFRAKKTADIIGMEKKLIVKTSEALREKAHGKYEGMPGEEYKELFTKWAESSDEERLNYKVTEDGETPNQAMQRFMLFLRELSLAYTNETVLVVTHGGIMRDFLIKMGLRTYDNLHGFHNTGYIKLRSDGVDFFIDEIVGDKQE
jgi:broad specificity phosphatase PhoE